MPVADRYSVPVADCGTMPEMTMFSLSAVVLVYFACCQLLCPAVVYVYSTVPVAGCDTVHEA